MNRTAQRNVVLFLVLVLAFSAAASSLKASPLIAMWGPGVATLLTSAITRRSLKEIGWKPGRPKWLAAGWLIPVAVGFAAYGLIWMTGLGAVPSSTFLERARLTLGMPAQSNALVIVSAFAYITILGLLPGMVAAVGEEIGWRGFLVPELAKWMTFRETALVSGVVWAVWHLPAILSGGYGVSGTPRWYQVTCFLSMVMSSAVIAAWLRLRSGSIWPATIMHATHNGAIQAFFDRITQDTGHTAYFVGEFGIALVPFLALVAWYCIGHSAEPGDQGASSLPAGDGVDSVLTAGV